ncbi:MAG: aminotransferase class I/II-fold pyridoxal phosphate-dependent enzyme [Rhodothermales bacterium]
MNDLETILAHAGCTGLSPAGDLVDPIQLSTTFQRGIDGSYPAEYSYTRSGNPTRSSLEDILARLEGGHSAGAFASGMAAAAAVFATLPAHSHVVIPDDVYHGVRHLLAEFGTRWGLSYSSADMTSEESILAALTADTKLVWVETPSNPQLQITDLETVGRICRQRGVTWAVDGTWTTPLIQRPLEFGANYVVHSLTKYLSGHSDVLGGAVVSAGADDAERIRSYQTSAGAVLDPFSCWLTMRGLRTLAVRLERQCESAAAIASHLSSHPRVVDVLHPSLVTHVGHQTAKLQMRLYGAMISILVDGGAARALEIVSTTRVFQRATSLGGTESLIEHRRSIEGPASVTPDNLIRMSIGLESSRDLIADLDAALST